MKRYPELNYNQRPNSYWDDQDVLSALLRNVKGRERRTMIRAYWQEGRLDELHEGFLEDTLTGELRERLAEIHPIFMGGEYLPDYKIGEVEIARIELDSTTRDVISIRAGKCGRRIRYRVVDEYGTKFCQQRQTSVRPLSLGELIEFLDGTGTADLPNGVAVGYSEALDGDLSREYLATFTRLSSEFYPELASHYRRRLSEWAAEDPQCAREIAEESQSLEP